MAAQQKAESVSTEPDNDNAEKHAEFADFSSHIAPLLSAIPASSIVSLKLADALADAIMHYWQYGVDTGNIDPTQPLYLLDLNADEGHLAWLLNNALALRLGRNNWPFCYVACCNTPTAADTLLEHPYLTEAIQTGKLDATVLHPELQCGISLRYQNISLLQVTNPLIVLSLDYFSHLAPELVAAHYGKLMRGNVMLEGDEQLRYQWVELEQQPDIEQQLALQPNASHPGPKADLLAYYQTHLASAAVLLPSAALAVLQYLMQFAGQRYLLLACDYGAVEIAQIRKGALFPPAQWQQGISRLPVNYHAISWVQQQQGAWVWNRQLDEAGYVLHAAWGDHNREQDASCFDSMIACLEAGHPNAQIQLLPSPQSHTVPSSAQSCLSLLRASNYDPALLKSLLPHLVKANLVQNTCVQREWQYALERTWRNLFPLAQCNNLYQSVVMFAIQLDHFGLAKAVLAQILAWYGNDADDHYWLAWCEAASGQSAEALSRLEFVLGIAAEHPAAKELHQLLAAKLEQWQNIPWYQPDQAQDGHLRLEPLGIEHADALFYQLRDPQISVLTRLPSWGSVEELNSWISQQKQESARCSYAVVHAAWGVVGVVSCHTAQESGYFYYWIGCDFQQKGFGQRAAKLCLAQMAAFGIEAIYTSVDHCNQHSQYLMNKLGFERMEITAEAPDETQYFYHVGAFKDDSIIKKRLQSLCEAIGYSVQFRLSC